MGLFNRIIGPCPSCGDDVEFQSKGGHQEAARFTVRDAPEDVLKEARDAECACGARLRVKVALMPVGVVELR